MNGHINETAPPLVSIGEVKLVQVQIVVWFVRTCEVWILFVFALLLVCLFPLGRSTVQSHQRGDLTCFFSKTVTVKMVFCPSGLDLFNFIGTFTFQFFKTRRMPLSRC